MTPADRIARVRKKATYYAFTDDYDADVLALCDDYETLAARCTLTDDETEAVRRYERNAYTAADAVIVRAVLRRLLGETS